MNHCPRTSGQIAHGCLIALVVVFCLIILAIGGAIFVFFYTPLPFRWVAAGLERTDPNIKIEGVGGSLSSGPSVETIRWGTGDGASEIANLRIKYNGFSDMRKSRQLIFSDVGVSRAHLDVSDIHWQSTNTTTSPTVSRPNQANPALPANLSAFRIDRVSFEDVLITNRHTGFHLEIPKIEWTGFKVTDDAVEPGNITVQSDRLDIRTRPGRTVPIAGKPFPFQKTLEISAKPQLHPALRQPLACLVDFSLPPRGEMMSWHIAAADGAIEASGSGGSGQISVRDFDAARLLDSAALFGRAAPDLPTDLTFKLTTTSDPAAWRLAGGQFRLGTAQFEIHPCVSPRQLAIPAVIRAVAHVGPEEISWLLPVPAADEFPPFQPRFSANPEIPLPAVLALVFFGKPYAELSAAERAAIDAKVPAYTPPVPPPPATGGQ